MMSGSSFTTHIPLRSDRAGCHCSPCSHALIRVLELMLAGSSFTTHMSLSSDLAGGNYLRFSHALFWGL